MTIRLLKILTWLGALILLAGPAVVFFTGCGSILPSKKTDQAAMKAAENLGSERTETLRHVVEGTRQPQTPQPVPLKVGGLWNKVDLKYDAPAPEKYRAVPPFHEETTWSSDSAQQAGSSERSFAKNTVTIPLGVSIALLGVGLIILLVAVTLWRRSSAAANAAYEAGDQGIAQVIRAVRARAVASTDPATIAHMNAIIAEAEAERGKMVAK